MDNVNCDDNGKGAVLYVELSNFASISMNLDSLAKEPLFSEVLLSGQKYLAQPSTDGDRVFWSNGAELTLNDVTAMILA